MEENRQTDKGRTGSMRPDSGSNSQQQVRLKTRPDSLKREGTSGKNTTGETSARSRSRNRGSGSTPVSGRQARIELTEDERRRQMREYREKKELYKRKRLQKKIMKKGLLVLGVVGLILALTGVIMLVRKISADRERRAAEAAAAAEIARTQTQVKADQVLHLSFPVLTLDPVEKPEEDEFVDEDGDGIPDDDGQDWQDDTEEEQEPEGPVMVDTDGDGVPDTEAVVDTDGDGTPDAPEGAEAYDMQDSLTVQEFRTILQELYDRDYVLVDIYSLASEGENGFEKNQLQVPVGKKPLIISQRDVSYSTKSDGHVDRLIIDEGAVATEYIDEEGGLIVGEQDVIPVLETFVRQHPDFSFQGARGIVGVTGYRGLFGYQVVTDEAVITTPIPEPAGNAHTLNGGDSPADDGEAGTEEESAEAEAGTEEGGALTEDGTARDGETSGIQPDGEEAAAVTAEGQADEAEISGGNEQAGESPDEEQTADSAEAEIPSGSGQTGEEPVRSYLGNDAVKANVADVEQILNVLRGTGWHLACNGYSLLSYGSEYEMMKEDMDTWQEDIGSVLGTTDILIYPRQTDIGSWSPYQDSNEKYAFLRDAGFKYFCIENPLDRTWIQIQPSYVRQGIHEIRNYRDFEEIMQMPEK